MPVLTDMASAQVKRGVKQLYGKVLTPPALLVTDGVELVWACDVEISEMDPTASNRQFGNKDDDIIGTGEEEDDVITGLPGQDTWDLDASLLIDTTLHNVLISRNNNELIYADPGNAVILERSESGQWQIVGFAIERPGTYTLIKVDLGNMTIGTVIDMTVSGHLLTLGELGTLSPFGMIAFGASGVFKGGKLLRIA